MAVGDGMQNAGARGQRRNPYRFQEAVVVEEDLRDGDNLRQGGREERAAPFPPLRLLSVCAVVFVAETHVSLGWIELWLFYEDLLLL